MKTLLIFIFCALSSISFAQTRESPQDQIQVLAKIQTTGNGMVKLVGSSLGEVIPSILQDKKLEQIISEMSPGDEALVKGYITYETSIIEGQTTFKPIFLIESIKPISLNMLGQGLEADKMEISKAFLFPEKSNYSPSAIPLSTEVVSALTMTTTVLMLHSLTASASQPQVKQDLNSGLFLFAGAMATGVFIYDQLKDSFKKGKTND